MIFVSRDNVLFRPFVDISSYIKYCRAYIDGGTAPEQAFFPYLVLHGEHAHSGKLTVDKHGGMFYDFGTYRLWVWPNFTALGEE